MLKSPTRPPQCTHLNRFARDDQMVDDVAVLLAHAGSGIASDEDGGRVLEDHEDEEDETECRAGRVIARLLCHGHLGALRRGVFDIVGGHLGIISAAVVFADKLWATAGCQHVKGNWRKRQIVVVR